MVVTLNSKMTETKKTTSRISSSPPAMVPKCTRKLNEATMSTTAAGANILKKPSTYSTPLKKNRKLTITASTSAITWFLVSADIVCEMASMQPARTQLPR